MRRDASRLEQRLTDDPGLVRTAVVVFSVMLALVLFGLSAREFAPNQCATQMIERRSVSAETIDGACHLTFEDGTVEVLRPSIWATYTLAGGIIVLGGALAYVAVSRRRSR